jgi:hypothetical protein
MNRIVRSALVGTTLGAIGLTACDSTAPSQPAAPPAEARPVPAGEAIVEVIRKDLEDICKDPDPYSRARRFGTLLPALGPEAVPAVQQTLGNLVLDLRGMEVELLLRFWATHQPKEAALWARQKGASGYREAAPPGYRDVAIYTALSVWAQADPQAAASVALPWTEERDPEIEAMVPIGLVRGWYARGDPPELSQWIRSLGPTFVAQRAIAAYVRVKIEQGGSQAVMSWAESLPEEEDKTFKVMVFRRVGELLSNVDIPAAQRWCDAHCLGPYGANLYNVVARNWARRDSPSMALAWLATKPDGYERNLAVRMSWARWSRVDREEAMAWMAGQAQGEPGSWLRPIYPVYAQLLSEQSPSEAIRWASQIEEEKEREYVLISVARIWRTIDEAAASDWLRQSTLSEEAREQVLAPLEKRPSQPPG